MIKSFIRRHIPDDPIDSKIAQQAHHQRQVQNERILALIDKIELEEMESRRTPEYENHLAPLSRCWFL